MRWPSAVCGRSIVGRWRGWGGLHGRRAVVVLHRVGLRRRRSNPPRRRRAVLLRRDSARRRRRRRWRVRRGGWECGEGVVGGRELGKRCARKRRAGEELRARQVRARQVRARQVRGRQQLRCWELGKRGTRTALGKLGGWESSRHRARGTRAALGGPTRLLPRAVPIRHRASGGSREKKGRSPWEVIMYLTLIGEENKHLGSLLFGLWPLAPLAWRSSLCVCVCACVTRCGGVCSAARSPLLGSLRRSESRLHCQHSLANRRRHNRRSCRCSRRLCRRRCRRRCRGRLISHLAGSVLVTTPTLARCQRRPAGATGAPPLQTPPAHICRISQRVLPRWPTPRTSSPTSAI